MPRSDVGVLTPSGDAFVFALGDDRGVVSVRESGGGRRYLTGQIAGATDQGVRYQYSFSLEFQGQAVAMPSTGVRTAQTTPPGTDTDKASRGSEETLTNDAVMALIRAGLSERIIIAKIKSSRRNFDTSAEALIKLKDANVPEAVIEAMLNPVEPAPPPPPVVAPSSPPVQAAPYPSPLDPLPGVLYPPMAGVRPPGSRAAQEVAHLGEQRRALRAARGKLEISNMVFVVKVELVVSGRHAEYRIRDRQPVFHTYYAQPEQIQLARLRVGGKDDRNLKLKSAHAFQFSRTAGYSIDEDDEVRLSVEPDPQGGYRLRPQHPLTAGEYGFVGVWWGAGGLTGFVNVPEFGVD
jgi:hypothetical protein